MHIKTAEIGENFDGNYFERITYFSEDYFLDCDILFIDLNFISTEIQRMCDGGDMHHPGVISESTDRNIRQWISERKKQLKDYHNSGGNLFVLTSNHNDAHYFLQDSEGSVDDVFIDLLSLVGLDTTDFERHPKKGNNIVFSDSIFTNFFSAFDCTYRFSYTKYQGLPVARINNTKHPISLILSKGKGNIILLPDLKLGADSWEDFQDRNYSALKATQQIDQELKKRYKATPDTQLPEWCSSIYLSHEGQHIEKMNKLFSQRDSIQQQIEEQQERLSKYNDLKELLYSTSGILEDRVEQVFAEFGYEILFAEENRDDLILKYKQDILVVEVKGLTKSASESNAAQLMKWVNLYHVDHGIQPKGLLIANPYREMPIAERLDHAFPPQMLPYCQKMEIALLTTEQLLGLYLDYKLGVTNLKKIHTLFINTIGILEYKPTKIFNNI